MTFSPSKRSLTRRTPCVEGCCGPIFRMISSAPRTVVSACVANGMRWSAIVLLSAFNAQVFTHPGGILRQNVIILAKRVSLPFIGHQDALQFGMPLEYHAEHVVNFALFPVRRGPHPLHAGHALLGGCLDLQA